MERDTRAELMSTKRWECAGTSLSDTACESDKGPDRLGVQWGVGGERNGALQVRAPSEAGEEGRAEGARDALSLSLQVCAVSRGARLPVCRLESSDLTGRKAGNTQA